MQLWNTIEAKFEFEKRIVGDARIVIEVGAKTGDCTQRYLDMFPTAHVYAFEPSPTSYQVLSNLERDRITLSPLAVLDTISKINFNITNRPGSCSTLVPNDWDSVYIETTIEVPTTTLDNFCEEQLIDHIDLLTIDTEGTDLQVLKGASTLLSAKAVDVICTELIFWPYFKGQCAHGEIIKFLAIHGMHLVAIFPVYWEGSMRYADAIFVQEGTKDG